MNPNGNPQNLKPVKPGDPPLNPTGRNQYTYRQDAERHMAEWCEIYGAELIERLLDMAAAGNDKMMKLAMERILPAVTKHEVAVPGADAAGLAAALSGLSPDRRANGHDRAAEHPGANGASRVDS